ncbi:MAG: hypothetical protein Q9160_003332 [Pyrenula sp. 1 TL-2023]
MPALPSSSSSNLSPAELSYLHTSLAATPPIRPDSRTPTQFRPLTAETDVLPTANGSAHLSFSDGSEAIVGVKAEVEKTRGGLSSLEAGETGREDQGAMEIDDDGGQKSLLKKAGKGEWVELNIDISGLRDDDSLLVFLGEMMREALVSGGGLTEKLVINRGWHWKLYIDILLLSPFSASSLPLPLLSLTTHLALLSTRLPALKSQGEEDPLFDDDWAAATYLYPRPHSSSPTTTKPQHPSSAPPPSRPPITLLTILVGPNTIFDPSREELAVADTILAVSLGSSSSSSSSASSSSQDLHIISIRTLNPPARDTFTGVPAAGEEVLQKVARGEVGQGVVGEGVWMPKRGGVKRGVLKAVMREVVGVGRKVVEGLEGFVE